MRRAGALIGAAALIATAAVVIGESPARAADPLEIETLSPTAAQNTEGTKTLELTGPDFPNGDYTGSLRLGPHVIPITSITVQQGLPLLQPDRLTGSFSVSLAPPGRWDLTITHTSTGRIGQVVDAIHITALAPAITGLDADPDTAGEQRRVPPGPDVPIVITGQHFARGDIVSFGSRLSLSGVQIVSASQIRATAKVSTARADAYDLRITHTDGQTTLCELCFAIVPPAPGWMLSDRFSGPSDYQFTLGNPAAQFLACDWDGDGRDEPVTFRGGNWRMRSSTSAGPFELAFIYGTAGDVAICGDWNNDGIDTVGVRRGTQLRLRNANSGGAAKIIFTIGQIKDVPVVGDWDGRSGDSIALFRPSSGTWLVRNTLDGAAPTKFVFGGLGGDQPVAGDWNRDGKDTPGIRRFRGFLLRDTLKSGPPNRAFTFGLPGARALAGDWNGGGIDTVGIVVRT